MIQEIDRRKSILNKRENVYKEKLIPFAHGMRLFAEVYNDRVHPDDPFEFMNLLGAEDMLSVIRNSMIGELAWGSAPLCEELVSRFLASFPEHRKD